MDKAAAAFSNIRPGVGLGPAAFAFKVVIERFGHSLGLCRPLAEEYFPIAGSA